MFEPLFVKAILSSYSGRFSFRGDVSQENAVGFGLDNTNVDEKDVMDVVQDHLVKHPDCKSTFLFNPCDFGYCLTSIKQGKTFLVDRSPD